MDKCSSYFVTPPKSESGPIFQDIVSQAKEAVESVKFLPNSQLGKAVTYVSENHSKLDIFLKIPGVPLDTNHVERKIKCPIKIRKGSPIFKTEKGHFRTGNMLSLVETCRLNDIPPWDYLVLGH